MLKYVVIVVVLNCAVIMLRTYSTITTQLYIHVDIQFLIPNYIQFYSALHPSCLSYFCGTSSQDHSGLQIIQQENASQVCTSSALLSVMSVDKGVISSYQPVHYEFITNFAVCSVFQRMFQGDKLQITMVFTKDTIYPMDSKCVEIIVVKSSANA